MALNPATLAKQIEQAMKTAFANNADNPEQAQQTFAQQLATAIDAYVHSADVVVNPGILVSTSGTPVAQTGATTSTGSGKLV